MEIEYFIAELKKSEPSEKLMIEEGFDNMPYSIRRCYDPEKKILKGLDEKIDLNILEILFNNYDVQYLRFADFSFQKNVETVDGLNIFCSSSGTFLAFKNDNSEVLEYDREELYVLNYCAKDSESFLSALLEIFKLQSLRLQGIVKMNDVKANQDVLEKCILAAGGNKFKRFFEQIIY